MTNLFSANALLTSSELDLGLLFFAIISVVLVIFFLFLILTYVCRGIEFLLKPVLSSTAGKIIFSPAVGIPLFVVTVIVVGLIIFFTNQAEIMALIAKIFGT